METSLHPTGSVPEFLPRGRLVACACDVQLHAPVGTDPSGDNFCLTACLGCGQLTYTEASVDEPHAGDIRCHGHLVRPLPQTARAWLDRWPRLLVRGWHDFACVPASTRCSGVEEFTALADAAWAVQSTQSRGDRLRAAGVPAEPPPPELPGRLEGHAIAWRAAQLTPECDADQLLRWADPRFFASVLAIGALLHRPDLPALLEQAARSGDLHRRAVAWAIVADAPELQTTVLPLLLEWLTQVPLEPSPHFPNQIAVSREVEEALDKLLAWKPPAESVAPALREASARIGRNDYALLRRIATVLRQLTGEPPLPITTPRWFFS